MSYSNGKQETLIKLTITAPKLDFDFIETMLGLEPEKDRCWHNGDLRRNGKSNYDFSRWTSKVLITESILLDEEILGYLEPIKNKKEQIIKIKNKFENHSLFLVVVPYIGRDQELPTQIMPHDLSLMKLLIDLDILLDIDYYLL